MKPLTVPQPVKGDKLPLTKKFEELVLAELPIHAWEAKQKEIRKKIKI